MLVLDTTVLIYAVGSDHPLRPPCQRLIQAIERGEVDATTSVEAIQEFTHVRGRRYDRDEAAELAEDFAELLRPLLVVETEDLLQGLQLFRKFPNLGSFDAVLAATARAWGDATLVSADKAFAHIPRLRHVVPDHRGVSLLLEVRE